MVFPMASGLKVDSFGISHEFVVVWITIPVDAFRRMATPKFRMVPPIILVSLRPVTAMPVPMAGPGNSVDPSGRS